MERDFGSALSDFGVRKYDEEIGRFTRIDPLFEKYYGWSPYVYSANNPVSYHDKDGRVIHWVNISNENIQQVKASIQALRNFNSPTINKVLDKAEGPKSNIFFNVFSHDKPVEGNTKSNVGRKESIEKDWNDRKFNAAGLTLKKDSKSMNADVIIAKEPLEGSFLEDGKLNPFGTSKITILDELNHAISKEGNQEEQHEALYKDIIDELNNGTIDIQIEEKQAIEQQFAPK